jgi:TonB-dependent Receptor Plug Domain
MPPVTGLSGAYEKLGGVHEGVSQTRMGQGLPDLFLATGERSPARGGARFAGFSTDPISTTGSRSAGALQTGLISTGCRLWRHQCQTQRRDFRDDVGARGAEPPPARLQDLTRAADAEGAAYETLGETAAPPPTQTESGEQSAANASPADRLQEIVVTAQKREENLESVPVSVQVIGRQALEEQNQNSFTDLARTVPSLHIATSAKSNSLSVRGIGSGPDIRRSLFSRTTSIKAAPV